MSLSIIPSTELIARIATMKKQPTPEKVWKMQHALQVNNEMLSSDPVCLYRNCLHHYSQHGKSWISDNNGKRKRCRCRHIGRPAVPELCKEGPSHGPFEMRGNSLIKLEADKKELEIIKDYLDPLKSNEQIRVLAPRLMKSSGEFKAEETRALLLKGKIKYDPMKIVRYPIKPLDVRVAYLDSEIQPLFSRPSPELLKLREIPYNAFLVTRDTADKSQEGPPFYYSSVICDYDCISGHAFATEKTEIYCTSVKIVTGMSLELNIFQRAHQNSMLSKNAGNRENMICWYQSTIPDSLI